MVASLSANFSRYSGASQAGRVTTRRSFGARSLSLSPNAQLLLGVLTDRGGSSGHVTLRRSSGLPDDAYWEAVGDPDSLGLVRRGPGRGGSLGLVAGRENGVSTDGPSGLPGRRERPADEPAPAPAPALAGPGGLFERIRHRLRLRRSRVGRLAAPVKPSEADRSGNHCAVVVSSFGSLIQAAADSTGGSGSLRTKRSGCAA